MAGVFFVVCVPTANYEQTHLYGDSPKAENDENIVKLDVELRNKNSVRHMVSKMEQHYKHYGTAGINNSRGRNYNEKHHIPMEKILDELLTKLEVEHVVWCGDKNGNYYEVLFPLPAGDPCENCLHCLTELGIGIELNSVVSVLPCSVVYSGLENKSLEEDFLPEDKSAWDNFVESVKSKLTVKQVVDGVKSGGSCSFDYIMLILTADCLAALGLVENNASNIVAAMLVSPLMGPVMSVTFGTIISDRQLQITGLGTLIIGMLISIVFGYIFGLLLGTTDMPWGFGDWPTEEMKGRGNARSLWMGVLWALPSGTGVALALLSGSAGPLIGVAISASLLPPCVNCGLFWALACIWLAREDVKIPHIKGELYYGNSTYIPIYDDYLPIEFAINGIISALLTVVNVIFIFITAVIMLKIKEVAAPYTSTPDVRRFWEKDIRVARENNRTIRRSNRATHISDSHEMEPPNEEIGNMVEAAIREAVSDDTFKKVKRISYSHQSADEVPEISMSPSHSTLHIPTSALSDLSSLEHQISTMLASLPTGSTPPLSRLHTLSRSFRHGSMRHQRSSNLGLPTIPERSSKNRLSKTISLDHAANRADKFLGSLSARELKKEGDDEEKNLLQ